MEERRITEMKGRLKIEDGDEDDQEKEVSNCEGHMEVTDERLMRKRGG